MRTRHLALVEDGAYHYCYLGKGGGVVEVVVVEEGGIDPLACDDVVGDVHVCETTHGDVGETCFVRS